MSKYAAEQARVALDSLDDFARMSIGVDAIGQRTVLEGFIAQYEQQAEWPSDAVDVMADAYVSAVNEFLGNMTESEWEADRRDKHAHLAKVARVGMRAALQSIRPPANY